MGWGGQEIRTLTEAAGFIRRGHRVVVYAAPGSRIAAEAPRFGVPLVTLSNGSQWKVQGNWSNTAFTAGTGYANRSGQKGCLSGG